MQRKIITGKIITGTQTLAIVTLLTVLFGTQLEAQASQLLTTADGIQYKVPTQTLPEDTESLLRWERCYGVTRRGDEKGISLPASYPEPGRYRPQDGDAFAWIDLPFGVCERLVGGSLVPSENIADALNDITERALSEQDDGTTIQGRDDIIEDRIKDFLYR